MEWVAHVEGAMKEYVETHTSARYSRESAPTVLIVENRIKTKEDHDELRRLAEKHGVKARADGKAVELTL